MSRLFICLVWLVWMAGGAMGQAAWPHRYTLGTPAQSELDRLTQWANANPQLAQQPAYQVIWTEGLVLAGRMDEAFAALQKLEIALHPRPVADTLRLQTGLLWVALHRLYQNKAQAHQYATEVFYAAPATRRERAQAAVALCLVPGPRADSALTVLRQAAQNGTVRPECLAFVEALQAQQTGNWGRAYNAPFPAPPAGSPAPVPGADLRYHWAIRRNEILLQAGLLPLALHNTSLIFNELQTLYGPRHPLVLAAQAQYAEALALGGWHPEAQAQFNAAHTGTLAVFRGAHPVTVDVLRRWAYALLWAADTTQALAKLQMARTFVLQGQPVDSLVLAELVIMQVEVDYARTNAQVRFDVALLNCLNKLPDEHPLKWRARVLNSNHSNSKARLWQNSYTALLTGTDPIAAELIKQFQHTFYLSLLNHPRQTLELLASGVPQQALLKGFSRQMAQNNADTTQMLRLFHQAQMMDAVWHTLRWGATRPNNNRLCAYDSLIANVAGYAALGLPGPAVPQPTPESQRYQDVLAEEASMIAEVTCWPVSPLQLSPLESGEAHVYLALADSALLFLVRTRAGATARRVSLGGLTAQRIQLLTTGLTENNFTMLRGAAYFLFQDLIQPWLGLLPNGTREIRIHPVGLLAEVPFGVLLPAVPETEDPALWPYFGNQFTLEYGIALPGSRIVSAAMSLFPLQPKPLGGNMLGQWQWQAPSTRVTAISLPPTGAALPHQPTGWAFAAVGYSAWVGHHPVVVVLPSMRQPAAFVAQLAGKPAFSSLTIEEAGKVLRGSSATSFPSFWSPVQAWHRR